MFTLANVLTRRASTGGIPRAARAARRLLVLFTLVGVSACGDATGLSRLDGTYTLRSIEGALVPASSGSYTVESGTLQMDSGDWAMELRISQGGVADYGRYRRVGSTIEFDSNRYQDFFEGTLYDSRTLLVEYDLGPLGIVDLEFRR